MSETGIFHDFPPRGKGKSKLSRVLAPAADHEVLTERTQELPAVAESVSERLGERSVFSSGNQEASSVPALVTMKIRRVCANPRMLECAYSEGGIERRMLVRVKKNANFKCGMELE